MVAITLMIAESRPEEKDIMVNFVMKFLTMLLVREIPVCKENETLMISYKLKNKPFIIGSFLPFVSCHTIFLKKSPINHIRYYQFIGLFSTINIDTHRFYHISLLNMRLLIGIMI